MLCSNRSLGASMTTSTKIGKRTRRGAIWASMGFLVAAVLFWFGLSQMASLSGELPVYDPTDAETATWTSGQTWAAVGGLLFVAWAITISVLRKKLGISPLGVVLITTAAALATIIVGATVWSAALPPLPDAPSF